MQSDEKLGGSRHFYKAQQGSLGSRWNMDAKRASRASKQPTNSKLHGRNFELEME